MERELFFGNPTDYVFEKLNSTSVWDSWVKSIIKQKTELFQIPAVNDVELKSELNKLLYYQKESQKSENNDLLAHYLAYDKSLMVSIFGNFDLAEEDLKIINELDEELGVVALKLKYYFQRPRPNVLAYYHKVMLIPCVSFNASLSPSFPSGMTFRAFVLAELWGSKNPEHYDALMEIAQDVALSRQYLGLNYESDIAASIVLSNDFVKQKQFNERFKL